MADADDTQFIDEIPALPTRADETHKGQVGRIVLIAGSRGMSGAALLSGLGALRGGAGLVRVLTPASVQPIVATSEACLMVTPVSEDAAGALGRAAVPELDDAIREWADVVAIGPGLGQSDDVRAVVEHVVRSVPVPLVLDADALNVTQAALHGWLAERAAPAVITPHPGELARLRDGAGLEKLTQQDDETRARAARTYAERAKCVVVHKGHRTVVATAERVYLNRTGNPGMATGGMGDVLTGLLAALLGQGLDAFAAARLAVHVHGAAGDLCARHIGPVGYLARELADKVPAAVEQANRPRMGFLM